MRFPFVLRSLGLFLSIQLAAPTLADAGPGKAKPASRQLREMSGLRSAVKRDPYTKKIVKRVLVDQARTIRSIGDATVDRLVERAGWVPLASDPELRKVTVATVMRKVRQRSEDILAAISANRSQAVWDVLFVGAGVHTAITANALSTLETDQPLRMLVVEATNEIGGTFRQVGPTVARNSANRAAKKGAKVTRGAGDKNTSEGPLGDPDADGQEWPALELLADTATVNLYASGTDFLMGARVDPVVERRQDARDGASWPADLRVTVRTEYGQRTIWANAVVDDSGVGQEKLGIDAPSQRLVQQARAKIDWSKPDRVPDLLFFGDAMKLAALSKVGRDPYRAAPSPQPMTAVTLSGLRVRTVPRARLRMSRDGQTNKSVPLDEVLGIENTPDGFVVLLENGREIESSKVTVEVGGQKVRMKSGASLDEIARAVGSIEIDGRPVEVRTTAVTRTVPARPERGDAGKVNLAFVRAFLDGRPAEGATIRVPQKRGAVDVPLDELTDLYLQDGVYTLVLKTGQIVRAAKARAPIEIVDGAARPVYRLDADESRLEYNTKGRPRPTIAVVGGRDSGRTFLEYLYGQAPPEAYTGGGKIDVAQRGDVGDVEWYVSESGPADCDAFLASTRSRYLRLAGKVREVDELKPRARLNKARVTSTRQRSDGRYVVTDSKGNERVVDKVIFATGFEAPGAIEGETEPVMGKVERLPGERIIAKKLVGKNVYRIGVAAGADVVGKDERFSTDENAGSIYALAPRDRALAATALANTPRTAGGVRVARPRRVRLDDGLQQMGIKRAGATDLETPLSHLLLRAEMNDVLGQVWTDKRVTRLTFTVSTEPDGQLVVSGVDRGAGQLAELIGRSPLLVGQLLAATADDADVEFAVDVRSGRPVRTTLKIVQ